jgi:serine/threonine-protein kinase HipA
LLASQTPRADLSNFLCTQLAFWLLAATDGHAKNFSVFLLPHGRYRMTPLYDVISVWPVVGEPANQVPWRAAKLAMAVRSKNVHCTLHSIQTRHWHCVAAKAGVDDVWEDMLAMYARPIFSMVGCSAARSQGTGSAVYAVPLGPQPGSFT